MNIKTMKYSFNKNLIFSQVDINKQKMYSNILQSGFRGEYLNVKSL